MPKLIKNSKPGDKLDIEAFKITLHDLMFPKYATIGLPILYLLRNIGNYFVFYGCNTDFDFITYQILTGALDILCLLFFIICFRKKYFVYQYVLFYLMTMVYLDRILILNFKTEQSSKLYVELNLFKLYTIIFMSSNLLYNILKSENRDLILCSFIIIKTILFFILSFISFPLNDFIISIIIEIYIYVNNRETNLLKIKLKLDKY